MTEYGSANEPWLVKKNNSGKALRAQLRDDNGPVNLTGCTLVFIMRKVGATTNKVTSPATITAAATGEVKYDWITGDLDTPGDYEAEFEVTFPTGAVMSWPTRRELNGVRKYLRIQVQPSLV